MCWHYNIVLATLHLVVLHLETLDYSVKVQVNIYTFRLLIYLLIINYLIWMWVCMYDEQEKVILLIIIQCDIEYVYQCADIQAVYFEGQEII